MNLGKEIFLHSRYNPQAEADRYVESLSLNEKIRYVILIEPGLSYMISPLRKRLPAAKLIALHLEEPAIPAHVPDSVWHPGTGVCVQDFLESEIPDSQALEIGLIEWRPSMNAYGEAYLSLIEETAKFIKRVDANARTLKAFGRRWFRNFFNNLHFIRETIFPAPLSTPLLFCGAGPGLEKAIPLIKERRDGLFILAASSAAAALKANDLKADMLISTDGGGWARFHLYDFLRTKISCPIAAAMTAVLPSQCEGLPILLLSDGSLWQTLILKALEIPFISLPQRGTVSATALDLAFALTEGDIFIAGIDLGNQDIRSHARPYSFDRFFEQKEERLNPLYSQVFLRSSLIKAGGSYDIYASWFEKQILSYPRKLYQLGENNRLFGTFQQPEWEKTKIPDFKTIQINHTADPSRKAYFVLEEALKDPVHSATLLKELSPLLIEGTQAATSDGLIDTIRSLADPGGKLG